jgi:RNA recognition motif-containing protein
VTTLLVGNLSPKTTANDLQAVFSAFGEIDSIRVACDSAGHARGFALVELDHRTAAIAMQALKGVELKGRMMDVTVDRPLSDGGTQLGRGGSKHRRQPSVPLGSVKLSAKRGRSSRG